MKELWWTDRIPQTVITTAAGLLLVEKFDWEEGSRAFMAWRSTLTSHFDAFWLITLEKYPSTSSWIEIVICYSIFPSGIQSWMSINTAKMGRLTRMWLSRSDIYDLNLWASDKEDLSGTMRIATQNGIALTHWRVCYEKVGALIASTAKPGHRPPFSMTRGRDVTGLRRVAKWWSFTCFTHDQQLVLGLNFRKIIQRAGSTELAWSGWGWRSSSPFRDHIALGPCASLVPDHGFVLGVNM